MPPKIQLLAVLAFGVAMLLIENQIQRLDESRVKLGKSDLRLLLWTYKDLDLLSLVLRVLSKPFYDLQKAYKFKRVSH